MSFSPSTSCPLSNSQGVELGGHGWGAVLFEPNHGRAQELAQEAEEAVVGRGGLESAWPTGIQPLPVAQTCGVKGVLFHGFCRGCQAEVQASRER